MCIDFFDALAFSFCGGKPRFEMPPRILLSQLLQFLAALWCIFFQIACVVCILCKMYMCVCTCALACGAVSMCTCDLNQSNG